MRILSANISAAPRDSETGRFLAEVMGLVHLRNFRLTAEADDQIVSRFPTAGVGIPDFAGNRYVTAVNLESVHQQILQAEKEGFDGAIITCVFDPLLEETRRAVDIPVVGLGESTLMMASLVGHRYGLVTAVPDHAPILMEMATRYGVGDRVIGIDGVSTPFDRQELAYFDAGEVIEDFLSVAYRLIREGADVLVPLCGVLSPLLRMAPGVGDRYPGGVIQVEGIPVVDSMGSATAVLRALFALKRGGSGWCNPRSPKDSTEPLLASEKSPETSTWEPLEFWDLVMH